MPADIQGLLVIWVVAILFVMVFLQPPRKPVWVITYRFVMDAAGPRLVGYQIEKRVTVLRRGISFLLPHFRS